jgi:hypothetical protein
MIISLTTHHRQNIAQTIKLMKSREKPEKTESVWAVCDLAALVLTRRVCWHGIALLL